MSNIPWIYPYRSTYIHQQNWDLSIQCSVYFILFYCRNAKFILILSMFFGVVFFVPFISLSYPVPNSQSSVCRFFLDSFSSSTYVYVVFFLSFWQNKRAHNVPKKINVSTRAKFLFCSFFLPLPFVNSFAYFHLCLVYYLSNWLYVSVVSLNNSITYTHKTFFSCIGKIRTAKRIMPRLVVLVTPIHMV